MNVKTSEQIIGTKILSINSGVGVISGIEAILEGGEDYYVIKYGNKDVKNYFPVNQNKKIRFIAPLDEFDKEIQKLKTKETVKTFQNRDERKGYFKSVLQDGHLNQIIDRVLEIKSIDDLAVDEKEKYNKLIKTLESEASIVFDLGPSKSQKLISDLLN